MRTGLDSGLTARFIQVLRIYCYSLDPAGIADLRGSLRRGRYRWFHDEFTEALTTGALGDAMWSGTVGPPIDGTGAEAQRRRLWHVLFPGEKFPTA